MTGAEQIELMRKVHHYGNTLVTWAYFIQEAIKENDITKLHGLKMPEGFIQGDYQDEEVKKNIDAIKYDELFKLGVAELSDKETHTNSRTTEGN